PHLNSCRKKERCRPSPAPFPTKNNSSFVLEVSREHSQPAIEYQHCVETACRPFLSIQVVLVSSIPGALYSGTSGYCIEQDVVVWRTVGHTTSFDGRHKYPRFSAICTILTTAHVEIFDQRNAGRAEQLPL